jgi:GH24 family phage-related lysozyme (muramidase)
VSAMTGLEIAIILIKHFEGCRLVAYQFPGETSWATIGYGHWLPLSQLDTVITQLDADELLETDLTLRDNDLREQLGAVYSSLIPGQLGATLSFKFNCLPTLFDNSTFLMLMRQGALVKAQAEFKRWIYGEGRIALPGLVRRRKCEAFIYGGGTIEELEKSNWFIADAQVA